MKYIDLLMSNLDPEGCIVFQGMVMAGYSPRQAILNAYGICVSDELTRDPFTAYHTINSLPKYVADAILSTPEKEIEEIFWRYHERL